MVIVGLDPSFKHNQNGMTESDMRATQLVADRLEEVIIFRSTGPWAKRWLEKGYPSKNFHVKGKSSDWGPHAGLVPYDGTYSKVGYDTRKAADGTQKNNDGLDSGFAGKQPLVLSAVQIDEQLTRPEGRPARTAIDVKLPIPNSRDLLLVARRSGDQKSIVFRAFNNGQDDYEIRVYPPAGLASSSPHMILDRDPRGLNARVFEVMTSQEVGAGKPMTGDYDLFAICPSWAQYGNSSTRDISKDAIRLMGHPRGGHVPQGMHFAAGSGMDRVMDPRLHTMSQRGEYANRQKIYKERMQQGRTGPLSADSLQVIFDGTPYAEHGDMGNLTPRILRCINELNVAMGAVGDNAALRRVHHNAESHRYRAFGALSAKDMVTIKDGEQYGDGFPLTVFQPGVLCREGQATVRYGSVCTLENLQEFKTYALALKDAGYFVPKNWIWG